VYSSRATAAVPAEKKQYIYLGRVFPVRVNPDPLLNPDSKKKRKRKRKRALTGEALVW
jgi:hypothetical protein